MSWRSTKPPSSAARAAKRALEIREKQSPSNKAGTSVGLSRANQFARRESMSIETIRRINSFFARHGESPGSKEARKDSTSKAAQAWGLWGGNAGRAWAKRELARYERERKK